MHRGRRAAQHDRVAGLQAQRGRVDRDVRPRLVDDRDDAERDADLGARRGRWAGAGRRSPRRPGRAAPRSRARRRTSPATRPSSSARRSSSAASSPLSRPACMSRALASRISAVRASSASAIACSAASLVPVWSAASAREASRAARHSSRDRGRAGGGGDRRGGGGHRPITPRRSSRGARPRPWPAAGPRAPGALQPLDLAQLGRRVVADALADDALRPRRPRRRRRRRSSPRTSTIPTGSSDVPPSRSARAAPASTTTVPCEGLAYLQPQLEARVARLAGREARPVGLALQRRGAAPSPRQPAADRWPGSRPRSPSRPRRPSSASRPSRAATSCGRCPRPRGRKSATSSTSAADGSMRGIGRQEPVGVGQQHEQVGADQDRDLRGEEVVVAEGDLVGRRGVVLVDDRHHAPVEQPAQRLARVEVVGARAHVEEGQQHLGAGHAALAQQLVVDAVELALADGAGRLEVLDRRRARREPHRAACRARSRRWSRRRRRRRRRGARRCRRRSRARTSGRSAPESSATMLDPSLTTTRATVAQAIPGRARTRRRRSRRRRRARSPRPRARVITPMRAQAPLDVGQRLLVVEVVARDQALDRLAADAEDALLDALDREAALGRRTEDPVLGQRLLGGELGPPAAAGPRRGTRRSSSSASSSSPAPVALEVTSTGTSARPARAPPLRSRRGAGALAASRGRPSTARAPAAARRAAGRGRRARLDRRVVVERIGAVERREVEHVHEQPACARRGRGSRGRGRRRRWRPRSAPGCRRSRAGDRRPRASRAPARAS